MKYGNRTFSRYHTNITTECFIKNKVHVTPFCMIIIIEINSYHIFCNVLKRYKHIFCYLSNQSKLNLSDRAQPTEYNSINFIVISGEVDKQQNFCLSG